MNRFSVITMFVMLSVIVSGCATNQSPSPSLVGTAAPGFTLENALGGQTSLSDYEGTPVLLFFHMAVG